MVLLPLLLLAIPTPPEPARSVSPTTLPQGHWELRASAGIGGDLTPRWDASAAVGLTDQLQVSLIWPELAVRFGTSGDVEGWVAAGLYGVRFDPLIRDQRYELGPALGMRWWGGPGFALAAGIEGSVTRWLYYTPTYPELTLTVSGGVSWAPTDRVTLHFAIAASNTDTIIPNIWLTLPRIGLGSVQRIALRRPPLVQVRLLPFLSAELLLSMWTRPGYSISDVEALAGISARWP